jgi:hypothetical protein
LPAHVGVEVLLDQQGVQVIAIGPQNHKASLRGSDRMLRFELRADDETLLSVGKVADPRYLRSEFGNGKQLQMQASNIAFGVLTLRLPRKRGNLVLFENRTTEIGRTRFDPDAPVVFTARIPEDIVGSKTLVDGSGDVKANVDVVFLSDGYTLEELDKYHADVQRSIDYVKTSTQFGPHNKRFNFWRVDVPSKKSGIPLRSDPAVEDTAFGTSIPAPDDRCVFIRDSRDRFYANLAAGANRDVVVILANSDQHLGCASGGLIAMAPTDDAGQILLHEIGHAVFGLADEYAYVNDPVASCRSVRNKANVYPSFLKADLPWADLLTDAVALPTPKGKPVGTVGAFEGASYCVHGMYRPEESCLMRAFGVPLCKVCQRELDRYFAKLDAAALPADGGAADASSPDAAADVSWPDAPDPDGAADAGDDSANETQAPALDAGASIGTEDCSSAWHDDGVCDECLGDDPDCEEMAAPSQDPCASADSCGACTGRDDCGYCATSGTCMTGEGKGPSAGSCADWRWFAGDCVASNPCRGLPCDACGALLMQGCVWCASWGTCDTGDGDNGHGCSDVRTDSSACVDGDRCVSITSCEGCMAAAECGWCGDDSRCRAGADSGPAFGSCVDWSWSVSQCVTSIDPCLSHTSCDGCASTMGCGFCATDQACRSGNTTGPAAGSCTDWRGASAACAEPQCGMAMTCGACVLITGCGWCGDPSGCLPANASGPSKGSCDAWHGSSCAVVDPCDPYSSCSACTTSGGPCGWCGDDGTCRQGNASGPAMSTCSAWSLASLQCGD